MLVISLQRLWETASKFDHLSFHSLPSISVFQPMILPASKASPSLGHEVIITSGSQIWHFPWKVYSSTPPFFLSFLFGEVCWMGGQVEKRRGPEHHKKNVQISHLVVFMLQAPCGPWRCWKHGKHRRDQSNLISICSELEWPGCMARRSSETAVSAAAPSSSLCLCVHSRFFLLCPAAFLGGMLQIGSWEKEISLQCWIRQNKI